MFRCKLCGVSIHGERNFEMHLQGKKHRLRLHAASDNEVDGFADADCFKPTDSDIEVPEIAPGEPIPPGLEDVLENQNQVIHDDNIHTAKAVNVTEEVVDSDDEGRVCSLQGKLDLHPGALVGMDFLVEAIVTDAPDSDFFCVICDKKGPSRIVISHVATFNHQLKYLKMIFPAVNRQVIKKCTAETPKSVMSEIVNEICSKIESTIGRFKPRVLERDLFMIKKRDILFSTLGQHCERSKDIKIKDLIEIVNKRTDDQSERDVLELDEEDATNEDEREEIRTIDKPGACALKQDDESDDVQVLNVISKKKVLVDITKEDEVVYEENVDPARDDTLARVEEERDEPQAGCSGLAEESKNGKLQRSLSNLSLISSTSSTDHSLVELHPSPRSSIERQCPRRISPEGSKKSIYLNPAHRSHSLNYAGGRCVDRIPRKQRSRTRSISRSLSPRSRSRSRSMGPSRSSRSSSGSRSYPMSHPKMLPMAVKKARERPVTRFKSRSPLRQRSRSPLRQRSRTPSRASVIPRRQDSPNSSPSRYRERQRSKGSHVKGDAERNHGGHNDDRDGKNALPECQFSVWEKFRVEADDLEIDMVAKRLRYERYPEKHPRYASEWKKFYSRRMEEAKGHKTLDPRSEEFKLEWIAFWADKMEAMLSEELRERKDAIRRTLGLPDEPPPYEVKKKSEKHFYNIKGVEDYIPPPPRRLTDGTIPECMAESVFDDRSTWRAFRSQSANSEFEELWCDSRVGLIPTLRIVSALEEQLGSLGPRVNCHLSRALALQRVGSSLIPLIKSSDIVVLLETTKEKLVGQLQTGIVRRSMIAAVNTAIKYIAELLEKASGSSYPFLSEHGSFNRPGSPLDFEINSCNKRITDQAIPTSSQNTTLESSFEDPVSISTRSEPGESEPLIVPGIGEVNKDALAQHIAMALVERGRTNVSEAELMGLIEEVVGLAQAQVPTGTYGDECQSAQRDWHRNALEVPGGSSNLSLDDLMAQVCDRACMNEKFPREVPDEPGPSKYTLIPIDMEPDSSLKSYQELPAHALIAGQEQRRSVGRVQRDEIRSALQRYNLLTKEEQFALINFIQDNIRELPEEGVLLNRVLLHGETEGTSACFSGPSSSQANNLPQELDSTEMPALVEANDSFVRDLGEGGLEQGNQGDLPWMNRSDVVAEEGNTVGNFQMPSSYGEAANEQYMERVTFTRVQLIQQYSRVESTRQQLVGNHSHDYVQAQNLSFDEPDYSSAHGSGHGHMAEGSYHDYYPNHHQNEGFDVQDNRNPNPQLRQFQGGGNPDPEQHVNDELYFQQMAHSSRYEVRERREFHNYPPGDNFDY